MNNVYGNFYRKTNLHFFLFTDWYGQVDLFGLMNYKENSKLLSLYSHLKRGLDHHLLQQYMNGNT